MNRRQIKQRIEKLKKVINYHRYLYHVLDKQEISDAALDSLKHELYKLEQQYPEFITSDSPTQRVAGEPLKGFKKVEHKEPMLSAEDIFSEKELKDWETYLKRLAPNKRFDYFCELKIDGFGIALIYKNGVFDCGATRGNGRIGEDVTQNLRSIESIPLKLYLHKEFSDKKIERNLKEIITKGKIEIRGEVYMAKKDFEKINQERKKKNQEPYSNPRNTAAGSIRQLNPKVAASRPLKFLAYDIITDFGQTRHSQEHQILSILGFKTDKGRICKDLNEIADYWQEIVRKRDALAFQIDGLIINVNDNSLFQKLGVAGKSPRAIRAFKFPGKQAVTVIRDIKLQIGRTGAVTPVAWLKPVKIGGAIISRATLHNEDEIKRLGVRIGDTVIVERAGDVIPDIVKVLTELRTGKEIRFRMPKNCPVCGSKLVKPKKEKIWRCPNPDCFDRKKRKLYHFVSRAAFDIDGMGPQIINQLLDEGLISDAADIFELKQGDLLPLERFAQKSAENLIAAIQKSKKINLARFIYALGIRNVGEETAFDLTKHFSSLKTLRNASQKELEQILDIGPVVAQSIYNWFRNKNNLKFLKKLEKNGIKISEKRKTQSEKLKGKIFVLSGELNAMTREKAKERIRSLGGKTSGTVSKKTDYLVMGREPGLKYKKAKELGVKIIKENEFLEIIEQA